MCSSDLKNLTLFAYTNDISGNDVVEINLNDYIKEKKVYDTLNFDGGKGTQAYTVYWTYKSNEILGFSETFGAIFKYMAIDKIFADIYDTSVSVLSPTMWTTMMFKVEYVPYYETMRSVQYRDDFEPYALTPGLLDQFSGLIINQGERINELYDLTENVYGQIQRIGVDTVSISKKLYRFSQLDNLGDYTADGYFLTKAEVMPYTTYLIARYELSKNWNRIAQFIQIDKEFRPYEVSLTKTAFTLKRDVLMNIGFVEVSTETDTLISDYDTLRQHFLETFKSGTYDNEITALTLRPDYRTQRIVKPVGSLAEKNALKWKLDLLDTKLAGKRVIYEDSRYIQKAVNYTDDDGEIENIEIDLYHGIWQPIEQNLEIVDTIGYDVTITAFKQLSDYLPLLEPNWEHLISGLPIFTAFQDLKILEYSNTNIYTYPTLADFPSASGITLYELFIAEDTYIVYLSNPVTKAYDQYTYVIAKRNEPIHSIPEFGIKKDSAELLGLEIALPVVPRYDLINTFVIGSGLLKENVLIKIRSVSKTLYFYGLTQPIEKTKADKIDIATASQLETVSSYVSTNYIDVPASATYGYDYFAIADSEGNLYLGVNQKVYGGTKTPIEKIYFNFVSQRTYPEVIADDSVSVVISVFEESIVEYTVIAQEFYKVDVAFRDSDIVVATASQANFIEYMVSVAFRDSDKINTTAFQILNTLEPLVSYVNYSYDGVRLYTYNFTVKNNDEVAAEIFASTVSTPTTSRGVIASQSSVAVTVISEDASVTLYAKAKATGENYSTVDSAVGSIY